MRTKGEVQREIDWREKEIERLRENPTADEKTEEYNHQRIINMSFAVEWCKWFLNEE